MTYFAFFTSYFRSTSKYKSPQGQCNGGFFAVQVWGAFIWRSLFSEFYGTPIIQFVRMNWSFLLKKRNTLLSVGIVFVKHTLKFRKYVKIFQIIKTLFVMYHGHLKVTTNSIFSLICPFQEPVMLSTTH